MEVWECIFLPVHSVFPLFLSCFFFFLSPAPAFARSLRQAHHVCVRTLPPWWWASYMCRPHGVAAFARCFLYHLWKQGDQRTMRYHFLNPCFIFSTLSFSSFVQTGAFYFLSSSSCHLESYPDYSWGASFVIFTKIPQCHWGLYSSQRNSDGWEGGITMTIPPHLLPVWLSICQ